MENAGDQCLCVEDIKSYDMFVIVTCCSVIIFKLFMIQNVQTYCVFQWRVPASGWPLRRSHFTRSSLVRSLGTVLCLNSVPI